MSHHNRKRQEKMERLICVNQQFSKENSVSRNVCVNNINRSVHEICNDSCCKMSYSHDSSSDNLNKSLEPAECVPVYQCDKPSDYVFVNVGCNPIGSEYLLEQNDDICKVSSETLFTDKEIDYNLFKNITIERCLKNSSEENKVHNHNLETTIFNIGGICIGNDRSGLSTNVCTANMCDKLYDYEKKPSIDVDYTTASTVVSPSGGFKKENVYVKEEKNIDYILVPYITNNMSPEIKKEEMVYSEVSVLQESIIDIKLHPVEESPDVSTIYSCVSDNNSKTGCIVLSKSVNTDCQEVHAECSEEVPDNYDIGDVMDRRPLEKNEAARNKRESHLKVWNKTQTLNRTCSERQIKPQTNSGDDTGAAGVEEYNNKLNEDDVNTHVKNKNDVVCQYHRRRKSKSTTDRHYICEMCEKDFTQLCDLKAHKCTHTKDRIFACDTCGKTFKNLTCLKQHKLIHTGDRPFGCDTCDKMFTQESCLKRHKCIHTGNRSFACDTCGKTFKNLTCFKQHKLIHTDDTRFGCDICGKTFTQNSNLKDHIRVHTGDKPFGCDICGKTFTQKCNLKAHKPVHTDNRPFGCDTCGRTFKRKCAVKNHIHIHISNRPFGCDTCGKTFAQNSNLKDHARVHTGYRPFGCDTCGKSFRVLTGLKRHKLIHTGDRPFGCDTCGKSFRDLTDLKHHKLVHTGDRPFGCDTCGKSFKDPTGLKHHKLIHTGDRPFGCDTCGKTFALKNNLTVHTRIHTGDRPYGCDICGNTFTQLSSLKNHKRLHTGDRPF